MNNKILIVALRDYAETVKTKTFLFSLLLPPLVVGLIFTFSGRFQRKAVPEPQPERRLAVLDLSGEISADLDSAFNRYRRSGSREQVSVRFYGPGGDSPEKILGELKEQVHEGRYDALLVLEKEALESGDTARLFTGAVENPEFLAVVRNLLNQGVTDSRFRSHGLSPQEIAGLHCGKALQTIKLAESKTAPRGEPAPEKKPDRAHSLILPSAFMMLMLIGIMLSGQGLLNSVIEEKASRVIEVLLAALSPFQLMAGKIIGQAAIGLTLLGTWAALAYGVLLYKGMGGILSGGLVWCFIIYFVLGFLLYSCLFAAIGAACNTLKESQNLLTPVMLLLMLPMIFQRYIVQHPQDPWVIAMSLFPPLTPLVMLVRIAVNPALGILEIIASMLVLGAAVPVVIWAAAKIFRTGILMYGKTPSPREILRWLR